MSDPATITVIGKADLGYSPYFRCEIRAGEKYTIAADDYTEELFKPLKSAQKTDGGTTNE